MRAGTEIFCPGQFLILQIEGTYPKEAHPFTIASTPTQKDLSISVKAVGDFTSRLSEIETPSAALIDMPYGTFIFLKYPGGEMVFIAGGIGITPVHEHVAIHPRRGGKDADPSPLGQQA